ncbi:MAG: hypothetical protein Q4Q04_06510, partial [Methanocorpusculum sp.]|nr:hypothetical protein [Methanocorpusculum sp.]
VSLDDIRTIGSAGINLAVSSAGIALARRLEMRFGTPYVVGTPCGTRLSEQLAVSLKKNSAAVFPSASASAPAGASALLIVAERVFGDSLRRALRLAGCRSYIAVGSLFGGQLTEPGDVFFRTEKELVETIRSGRFTAVCGDPFLWRFPGAERVRRYAIVHPAVSSTLTQAAVPRLVSPEFDELIETIAKEMNDEV